MQACIRGIIYAPGNHKHENISALAVLYLREHIWCVSAHAHATTHVMGSDGDRGGAFPEIGCGAHEQDAMQRVAYA